MHCSKYRNTIAKLRLSSHQLNIETGRRRNISRSDRKCTLCNSNDIEDEYHFVLICPIYYDLRKLYIPRYYHVRPSMFKFIELLNTSNLKTLNKLALFCNKSFIVRNETMNNLYE